MNNAGKIAIVPAGEYDSARMYSRLSCVRHNGKVFLSKKETLGHEPIQDDEWWMYMISAAASEDYVMKTDIATIGSLGIVKPDGQSIVVDGNGTLSAKLNMVSKSVTLDKDSWDEKFYVIEDSDITADANGFVGVSALNKSEERNAVQRAVLGVVSQDDGSMTLVADGIVPKIDIPVSLILFTD